MATLQNIGKLKYRGKDGQWHPLPVVVQDADGGVSTISGKGAPTSATHGKVNQLYRNDDTQKLYICTATAGGYTWAAVVSDTEDAVTYTAQTLTEEQKTQARANIGAGTSNFSGLYNDLPDKPNIPAATVIDTTLTKSGQAADAKAAGDAIEKKLDKAQGAENAGRVLAVVNNGNVFPVEPGYLPGLVSYTVAQGLTHEQQELAKQNIGAGTLRKVYYWDVAYDTPENPNSVMRYAEYGDTCICLNQTMLPHGMVGPVLVIYGEISYGRRSATAFDGSNATWTFSVNLSDYSYSTPIKKSGVPAPTTAQVGQIVKVKSVDESGKIAETETVDIPSGGTYTLPIASPTVLGGVKPIAKTDAMTQGVGVDTAGALWIAPSSGGTDKSLGITSATVGQIAKITAVDNAGKPTAWEPVDMPSGGGVGGHWETVLDTVWEQDVINPTAFDSETGIFTCAEGELANLALDTEYVFFQQCTKEGAAYNTILSTDNLKLTKLSDTTFSIDVTPSTTFVPTNVKFSKGACLTITDIDAKKIRLTLDGQFSPTATLYQKPFYGINVPFFGRNTGYIKILSAYQAYQQVTAEVESPYRIVGEILCGFNAPSQNASFHFKNNSFCCPLVPYDVPEGFERTYLLTSDGTKIAKLYSTYVPWHLGGANENQSISNDYLHIISGTKVKLERWVE